MALESLLKVERPGAFRGTRKGLYRHIFTHEKFGEEFMIIYSQSEMKDWHGGQGGGYDT